LDCPRLKKESSIWKGALSRRGSFSSTEKKKKKKKNEASTVESGFPAERMIIQRLCDDGEGREAILSKRGGGGGIQPSRIAAKSVLQKRGLAGEGLAQMYSTTEHKKGGKGGSGTLTLSGELRIKTHNNHLLLLKRGREKKESLFSWWEEGVSLNLKKGSTKTDWAFTERLPNPRLSIGGGGKGKQFDLPTFFRRGEGSIHIAHGAEEKGGNSALYGGKGGFCRIREKKKKNS